MTTFYLVIVTDYEDQTLFGVYSTEGKRSSTSYYRGPLEHGDDA